MKAKQAMEASDAISALVDPLLAPWLRRKRKPTLKELRRLLWSVSPVIAQQQVATARRNRLAAEQEQAVVELLGACGWVQDQSRLITGSGALDLRHFMHKTRFATKTLPQEVDIACGLANTVVLAMECKVTNDKTNSVKRVNDVLKKAHAWNEHWGSFVQTAALLQGVIAPKDVERLLAAGVHVFWSHDLGTFREWLEGKS